MNRKNLDGSFNITINGLPYNTIEGDKYYNETLSLYNSNPELFELEQVPEIKQLTYSELRRNEYGNIGEQLDMIYWDKINNTNNWINKITEIKNKYPKK